MTDENLQKAITEYKSEMIPIISTVYNLQHDNVFDIIMLAKSINDKLGFELFPQLIYSQLVVDFTRVCRAIQYQIL